MEKFVYEKHTFQDVKDKFENYIHNSDDIKRIEFAFEYASEKHSGQVRKSGEPYIIHIIEVAYILACLNAGPNTLIAGILHDVQEDCNVTNEEISKTFSPEIATLVDALTKIQALSRRKDKEFLAESHRKIFIAMARDVRVIIIKLADRLHNMRTREYLNEEKQQRIAKETLEVYAPIAHRLGMNNIKSELESYTKLYVLGTGEKIISQYPSANRKLYKGSVVALLTDKYDKSMPNLVGLSYKDAMNILKLMGVKYELEGKGYVVSQSIPEGIIVGDDATVHLTLSGGLPE